MKRQSLNFPTFAKPSIGWQKDELKPSSTITKLDSSSTGQAGSREIFGLRSCPRALRSNADSARFLSENGKLKVLGTQPSLTMFVISEATT